MAGLAALVAFAIWLWISSAVQDAREDAQRAASVNARLAADNARRLQSARADVGALAQQVERLGGNPVVTPGEVPVPVQGTPGLPGRAPTQAEIQQAVASYCQSTGACTGPAGADASVSAAQVAAAVVAYCDPRGDCQGPRGAAGEDSTVPGPAGAPGRDGADSTVPGPQGERGEIGPPGPPPSAEAVAQAVADFCARPGEPCRGPAGPAGERGAVGPVGPPGPTCPDGFVTEQLTVVTPQGGTRDILTCVPA